MPSHAARTRRHRSATERSQDRGTASAASQAPPPYGIPFADQASAELGREQPPDALPDGLRSAVEHLSGVSLGHVRVRADSPVPARFQARAVTQGPEIHLGPGQNDTLPHEAWHAAQQARGQVAPTVHLADGGGLNDSSLLEREADWMGERASQLAAQGAPSSPPTTTAPLNAAPVLQLATDTAVVKKTYATLMAGKMSDLLAHASAQADWHTHISAAQRTHVRAILEFARNTVGVAGACADWKVSTFWSKVKDGAGTDLDATKKAQVASYARGVRQQTAKVDRTSDVDKGLAWGESVQKLEAKMDPVQLRHIFEPNVFTLLHDRKHVDDFVKYFDTCKPVLHASDGAEIKSYLSLIDTDKVDPVTYHATRIKDRVRSYHRFHKKALDQLDKNYGKTATRHDVTLILHSALDHNGAFHREKQLTDVITDSALFTLMIEGFETLATAQAEMEKIARDYGKNGKIDQVMLAGHGNSRSIQMAGKVEKDGNEWKSKNDSIYTGRSAAKAFLDKTIDLLVNKASPDEARVVFNACLTDSNLVRGDVSGTVAEAGKKIQDQIKNNPSLAQFVRDRAKAKGVTLQAIGSVSSTTSGGDYLDAKKRLTLTDARDPKFTAPKIEYVKVGIEPTGALRAVLEVWADTAQRATMLGHVRSRAALGDVANWNEQLIRVLYGIIHARYKDDAVGIQRIGLAAEELSHFLWPSHSKPKMLHDAKLADPANATDAKAIFLGMTKTNRWTSSPHIPLVIDQVWGIHQAPRYDKFIEVLHAKFNFRKATQFPLIDIGRLDLSKTLPIADAKTPKMGRVVLALIGLKQGNSTCEAWLKEHLKGLTAFPARDDLANRLDGGWSEEKILIKLGKKSPAAPTVRANLQLEGKAKNTVYVKAMTRRGTINQDGTKVFKEPDATSADRGTLAKDDKVVVIGETSSFFAIEHGDHSGFVENGRLTLT